MRRVAFSLITLLLVFGLGEGIGCFGLRLSTGAWPARSELQQERESIIRSNSAAVGATLTPDAARTGGVIAPWQVVHPYLGYVYSPSPRSKSVNRYGFLGKPPPFNPLPEGSSRSIVGIFGGSVAESMTAAAADTLARELSKSGCFAGREIEIFNFSLPGVKQPQQLLTLSWFLTLGMHIDLVITLDGFNEIVLPAAENEPQGIFPFYPRSWSQQVAGIEDVPLMRRVGAIEFWQELRRGAASAFQRPLLRSSMLANFVWLLSDRVIDRNVGLRQVDLAVAQANSKAKRGGYQARGPKRSYANDEERYRDLAAVWRRSTELMHGLATSQGIPAFHFLQPNQRIAGSKPFTPEERAIALRKGHLYDRPARLGYPHLIREGEALTAAGVTFSDLTMVFEGVEEPLYIDDCCHVNERGSALLATEIARVIRESMAGSCEPPSPR